MEKSNKTSSILRQEGNEFYKKRQFFQALLKYNQSICFAEEDTENLGLTYANRSAVYFEIKLYEKCLNNIDLALKNKYPEKNSEILKTRSERSIELMNSEQKKKSQTIFKLCLPTYKKQPFIASCLKIKSNDKYGRHIVATDELSVGDVIAIDKPFCSVPISESHFITVPEYNIYQRCNNCLKHNHLNLMPCQNCCHAMFCSTQCHDFAIKYYHHYECTIITDILKSGSANMLLRIFFISLSIFERDICKLKRYYKDVLNCPKNIFDIDFSLNDTSDLILQQLTCLLCLSKSSKEYPLTLPSSILAKHPDLKSMYHEHTDFINTFIQHQSQISDHNFHGIFASNLNVKSLDGKNLKCLQEPIGSGSFLFTSLINHSCAPNILRICVDAEIYIIVCRRIEKGSQIFDCYKNNFMMENREQRQIDLEKEFNFRCECEACLNDWPTFKKFQVKDAKIMKYAKKINDELIDLFKNYSQLFRNFQNFKNILNENYKNYPSMELGVIQKMYATFLLKFAAESNIQF